MSPSSVWVLSVHVPHLTTRGPCFSVVHSFALICQSVLSLSVGLSRRLLHLFLGVPCLPIRVQFVCLCPSPSHPRAIYVCLPVFPFLCPVCTSLFPAYQCGGLFVHPLALSVFLSASALHLSLFIPCLLVFLSIHEFVLSLYAPSCLSAPLLVHPRTSPVHLSVSMPVCPCMCPICPSAHLCAPPVHLCAPSVLLFTHACFCPSICPFICPWPCWSFSAPLLTFSVSS